MFNYGTKIAFAVLIFCFASILTLHGAEDIAEATGNESLFSGVWVEVVGTILAATASLAASAIAWFFAWVRRKLKNDELTGRVIDVLEDAVVDTYHSFVKEAKRASEDGKLTREEAAYARKLAIEKAKRLADSDNEVRKAIQEWGTERLQKLIESIIRRVKGEDAASKSKDTETYIVTEK